MSIEIGTIALDDETIDRIAQLVVLKAHLGAETWPPAESGQATTQSNHPSPDTHRTQSEPVQQPQGDPWDNSPQGQQQAQQAAQAASRQTQATPTCQHGPMRYVAAGFSQRTGKAYAAFWGCAGPQGGAKCKSSPA